MLAAGLTFIIVSVTVFMALAKAAGKDKWKDKWIEQRKLEKEFDGHKYCENDCYMCDYQNICRKSAMREF